MPRKPEEQPEVEQVPEVEAQEITDHKGTVLRRDEQQVTAHKPTTVTRLKSEGWEVQQ